MSLWLSAGCSLLLEHHCDQNWLLSLKPSLFSCNNNKEGSPDHLGNSSIGTDPIAYCRFPAPKKTPLSFMLFLLFNGSHLHSCSFFWSRLPDGAIELSQFYLRDVEYGKQNSTVELLLLFMGNKSLHCILCFYPELREIATKWKCLCTANWTLLARISDNFSNLQKYILNKSHIKGVTGQWPPAAIYGPELSNGHRLLQ